MTQRQPTPRFVGIARRGRDGSHGGHGAEAPSPAPEGYLPGYEEELLAGYEEDSLAGYEEDSLAGYEEEVKPKFFQLLGIRV